MINLDGKLFINHLKNKLFMKYSKEQLQIGTQFIGTDGCTYKIIDISDRDTIEVLRLDDGKSHTFSIKSLLDSFEDGRRKLLTSNQIVYEVFWFQKGDWVHRSGYINGDIDIFRLTSASDEFPSCDLFRYISGIGMSKVHKKYGCLCPCRSKSLRHATLEEILLVDPDYKPITTQIVYEVY